MKRIILAAMLAATIAGCATPEPFRPGNVVETPQGAVDMQERGETW